MWSDLKKLAIKYAQRYWPTEEYFPQTAIPARPHPTTGPLVRRLMYILPAVPWGLGALLVAAIAGLDLNGFLLLTSEGRLSLLRDGQLVGQSIFLGLPDVSIRLDRTLLTVSVSGLIGYATNWLAITMLFQPRQRHPILGQGFIPAQQSIVIDRLARAITTHLINAEHLKAYIQRSGILRWGRQFAVRLVDQIVADPEFREDSRTLARRVTTELIAKEEIRTKVIQIVLAQLMETPNPIGPAIKLYNTMNRASLENQFGKLLDMLPGSVDAIWNELNARLDRLPAHIDAAADEVEEWLTRVILHLIGQLNMYELIASNLSKLRADEIESIIKSTAQAELNYIRYLGGVLGAFGGLIILDTWLLVPIALGLGALIGLDAGLVWARQRSVPV